jgi:hypothetical protein
MSEANANTLINEAEGLDLYIDVNVGTDAPSDSAALTATTDIINVVYAFKKKSSPTC